MKVGDELKPCPSSRDALWLDDTATLSTGRVFLFFFIYFLQIYNLLYKLSNKQIC
jgi:hypothetical protein